MITIVLYVDATDKRTQYLLEVLSGMGHTVSSFKPTDEPICLIVSPSKKPTQLMDYIELLASGSVLIGGQRCEQIESVAAEKGITYINAADDESFAIKNAVSTAEGAIMLLIRETERTVMGQRIALTGFGRINRVLAPMLSAMGARVSVFARSATDLALAARYETHHISMLDKLACGYDALINTVPARILSNECIDMMNPDMLIMELASAPYGFDMDHAEMRGIKCILAPGLPSVAAPYSAAVYLCEAILSKLEVIGYV